MNANERAVLHDIVDRLQSIATALDSSESLLIQKGVLRAGEIGSQNPLHTFEVGSRLSDLRDAIDRL